jgi:hypothetical protein
MNRTEPDSIVPDDRELTKVIPNVAAPAEIFALKVELELIIDAEIVFTRSVPEIVVPVLRELVNTAPELIVPEERAFVLRVPRIPVPADIDPPENGPVPRVIEAALIIPTERVLIFTILNIARPDEIELKKIFPELIVAVERAFARREPIVPEPEEIVLPFNTRVFTEPLLIVPAEIIPAEIVSTVILPAI